MDRMSIGDFARASGLTPKALRLYDEMGLLPPAEVDESSGYRHYEAGQLDRARLVAQLRLVGMSLDRIRVVADLPAAAQAAELTSYWRQVEADASSRRAIVALLVTELDAKEHDMTLTDTPHAAAAARSGIGARDSQLDALLVGARVFAVADGFGDRPGVAGGALDELAGLDEVSGVSDPVRLIDEAVTRAAAAVTRYGGHEVAGHPPGCTLTALVLGDGQVAMAHLGDSRAYLVRDGRLERLTRDHTLVQSMVDEGRLTEDEARSHPQRDLLNRALAPEVSAMPDLSLRVTRPGDRFVLTTDGVHAFVPSDELARLLLGAGTPDDVAAGVEAAVLAVGAPDNYGVVVVDLPVSG